MKTFRLIYEANKMCQLIFLSFPLLALEIQATFALVSLKIATNSESCVTVSFSFECLLN